MDTLITRYPVAFTGDAANLPLITPATPSAGVDTYSDRWIANRSTLAHGAAIDTLPNQVAGRLALSQGVAALRPLMQRAGDEAWMKFDGVDDYIRAAITANQPFTVAMVARIRSTSAKTVARLSTAAPTVQLVSDPAALTKKFSVRATTTIGNASAANPADGLWHFLAASFNGASSVSAMDTDIVTGDVGAGTMGVLSLGDTSVGVGNTDFDVAEVIYWPTALTTAQTQSVRDAMRSSHNTLLT